MEQKPQPLTSVIEHQTKALKALLDLGEQVYLRLWARLPRYPSEIEALPALFVRYGVQQLAAAHALAGVQAFVAAAPYARSLYEATVTVRYIDQDPTGRRGAAYVAHSIAYDEAEAEAHVPGTKSAETRMPSWNAAVGPFPDVDTARIEKQLRAARSIDYGPLVGEYLRSFRDALPGKVGRSDWGSAVGHDNLFKRADALIDAEPLIGLYRSIYRLLSRDVHAGNVLDGFVRNDMGETALLDVHNEWTARAAAVLDAITGLGLSLLDHVLRAHLDGDRELTDACHRIRAAKLGQ